MEDQSRQPVTGYPATANGYSSAHPTYTTTNTAGTAYPYAAPPPQPAYYNHPNPPYYPQPYSSQRATLFRRLFAIVIASFIITGTVIFIIWLILRPRLPDFQVDSLSLSNFNVSSSSLVTGNWDVSFTAQNPNHKIKLYYDQIKAYMYYKSESLSETSVPPFDQGTRNQTSLRATFAALSAYIDGKVANDINHERTLGSAKFNVRMLARVRFKAGVWRARTRILRVYCGDLSVGFTSNTAVGTLVGGSKDCRVGL